MEINYFDFLKFKDGEPVPVLIKPARGHNISIRIDNKEGQVLLSIPRYAGLEEGLEFLKAKSCWVEKSLVSFEKKQSFNPGTPISFLGKEYELTHSPLERGGVWIEQDVIKVSGDLAHFSRRVRDFLQRHFLEYAVKSCREKAEKLGVNIGRVSLKDTKSRWGSCSSDGNISLSWRLAFAPLDVIEYVLAHEVCHLREMNHGVKFWNLIYEVYSGDIAKSKRWLKENSAKLYLYE